ncbi:hypothetical protein LCGC14_2183050, partial [marine sediment metagenome]
MSAAATQSDEPIQAGQAGDRAAVVHVNDVSLLFDTRPALDHVQLTIPEGQMVALLGANGAGKSTLLKVLATLIRPSHGSLTLFGQTIGPNAATVRSRLGMIAHQPILYRDLSAKENLEFFGKLYEVASPAARADELLELVGLAGRAKDPVKTLSRGMTQRVSIARALMHDPDLLLADEINRATPKTLSALLDALVAINAAGAMEETLGAIARAAAAVLRAEAASVIMVDPARGKQVFLAAVGDRAEQLIGVEYDLDEGLSGKAAASGKLQVYDDVANEEGHYHRIDERIAFRTRSLIAAPLIHEGEVLGVVEVINPVSGERFNERDRQLAQIFANMAAIAASNARHMDRMTRENTGLKDTLRRQGRMVGQSPAMEKAFDLIRRVAPSNASVLLLGESGVGKELAAQMVHENSPRKDRAFIPVNCAALPETLLESELFGHEEGAFTGATARRLGRFELADGGTIFLDEIGEISPAVQMRLLRVLQEKEFVRVGGVRTIGCDVRVIAATNRDLTARKDSGEFREDLFYRLN